MKKPINNSILLFLLILITSCNQENGNSSKIEKPIDLKDVVKEWNNTHNDKDIEVLSSLYSDEVLYYKTLSSKNDCIKSKLNLFDKYSDFRQVLDKIEITQNQDTTIVHFDKIVTINNETKIYPSYLKFLAFDSDWKIIEESDLITDKNISKQKKNNIDIPENAVQGDFNGDKHIEYMWVQAPEFPKATKDTEEGELHGACLGECDCYIVFSDKSIPKIFVEGCIGGTPQNLGDLNGNNSDDIGLIPHWWQGCHMSFRTWTNNNGKFEKLVENFTVHCNQLEDEIKDISKDLNNDGYAIIQYVDYSKEMWEIQTKSVKMSK